MGEYKDGDRALCEGIIKDGNVVPLYEGAIHPHPGIPIADLIAERDALLEEMDLTTGCIATGNMDDEQANRWRALRDAREAAQKPKPKEGDEVTICTTATVTGYTETGGVAANLVFGGYPVVVHPDDIRPADE